jgi:hypothetical protein
MLGLNGALFRYAKNYVGNAEFSPGKYRIVAVPDYNCDRF